MVQSLEWKPGAATALINFYKHAEAAQEGIAPFKRGAQVVCKPGIFAFQEGISEVKDMVLGNVIVYFESLGHAQVYFPSELDAVELVESEKQFYNVSDLIADLHKGAFAEAAKRRDDAQYEVLASAWLCKNVPAARLPLCTIVRFGNGTEAVITGHSTASASRYRASWFDRRSWETHHQ